MWLRRERLRYELLGLVHLRLRHLYQHNHLHRHVPHSCLRYKNSRVGAVVNGWEDLAGEAVVKTVVVAVVELLVVVGV